MLKLVEAFKFKNTSLVGTIKYSGGEIPVSAKMSTSVLSATTVLTNKDINSTGYQAKNFKTIALLRSIHPTV